MALNILVVAAYLAVFLCIPLLIGVYVYRDAARRGMNAALWTVVAVLAPAFTGLIVYLLARGAAPALKCPQCGAAVTDAYAVCPACGARLRAVCPGCGTPVEPGWKVCPRCAAPLPQTPAPDVHPPERQPDRALRRVLLAALLIPAALIIAFVLSFGAFSASGASVSGVTSLPAEEYLAETGDRETAAWLDGCGSEPGTAHVLRYSDGAGTQFLIYAPGLGALPQVRISQGGGLFGRTVRLDIQRGGGDGGRTLLLVTAGESAPPRLALTLNDSSLACELTDVTRPLALPDT